MLVSTGPGFTVPLSEALSDTVHNGLLIAASDFLLLQTSFVQLNRLTNPLMKFLAESFHQFFVVVMVLREQAEQTFPDDVVDDTVEENLVNDPLPVLLAQRHTHAHQGVVGQLVPLHDLTTNLVTQFSCQDFEVCVSFNDFFPIIDLHQAVFEKIELGTDP